MIHKKYIRGFWKSVGFGLSWEYVSEIFNKIINIDLWKDGW